MNDPVTGTREPQHFSVRGKKPTSFVRSHSADLSMLTFSFSMVFFDIDATASGLIT